MDNSVIMAMVFGVIGGLGIFLLGMRYMSDGLQTVAGNRLRGLIGMVTNNRIMAIGVGTAVTAIVQSSSITTVMVVGFVNSGLMTLKQAIGVIMGSNIGTTITGWIVVLAVGQYGLPLVGVSALVFLFSKQEKIRYLGMTIMGVGMIFFGLQLMNDGLAPIRDLPEFVRWFHMFSADTYWGIFKCILVGCILTLIVQSSSATLAITMMLASTGIIGFESAAALVLGENIGTTITAFLASLGTTTNAKRAAYSHIVIKMVGVFWITILFHPYMRLIHSVVGNDPNTIVMVDGAETYPYIQAAIAASHTIFNIISTAIFIPLLPAMVKFLTKYVPDKSSGEKPQLTNLDIRSIETPIIAIEQSRKEIVIMGRVNREMVDSLRQILSTSKADKATIDEIFHHEEVLDNIQKEVMAFLTEVLDGNVPLSLSEEAQKQMRMADEYETLSDYVTTILKLYLRLSNNGIELSQVMREDLLELHDLVAEYFDNVNTSYAAGPKNFPKVLPNGDYITDKFRDLRNRHLSRLAEEKSDPMLSTVFSDMLNSYRRVKDHVLNIAEVIAEVKSINMTKSVKTEEKTETVP
ncbi:Na/Pi cotransporter family protein [Chitinispirillales bacterium ANBcel5]|uniref:Na/Pi cotransporter family protein n=1 Tax=Cellulosispirillum alkaliphilum TaxID=3039283 RepID=UPI002A50D394|nr:Na/Pi cotransporter family protein [Chitinispirillales bacterium ANBcel5]